MSGLSRRQVVQGMGAVGLGLLAGCGRLPGQAQPLAPKVPTLGYLAPGFGESTDSPQATTVEELDAFRQGLVGLGYAEGLNLVIAYRFGGADEAELREAAAELVGLQVDLIVTAGNAATLAARTATSTIPIVFRNAGDPVGAGLVASLARPGGNVTGLANLNVALGGKRLELLAQAVPGLRRVAFLWDPRANVSAVQEMQVAAQALGLHLQIFEIRELAELEAAFDVAGAEHADGLLMAGANLTRSRRRIVSLAASRRLPAIYPDGQAVREGGLMSYGADLLDLHRRSATYVDRILKGARPADLPVEQPMRFDFVINLKTAHALGLTIPHHVLLQATEVIQ
jgi:putative tryptophan/tyrosine transport system substrate-binding protein